MFVPELPPLPFPSLSLHHQHELDSEELATFLASLSGGSWTISSSWTKTEEKAVSLMHPPTNHNTAGGGRSPAKQSKAKQSGEWPMVAFPLLLLFCGLATSAFTSQDEDENNPNVGNETSVAQARW